MKAFKSYSPLPASPRLCTLNCRRISEGAATAAQQPEANTFNGFPLIEKICLHLNFFSQMGGCKRRRKINVLQSDETKRSRAALQMVSAVETRRRPGGNDNSKLFQQTNAIRGWPPSWLLRGQAILTPPTARKQHSAFFPIPTCPAVSADFCKIKPSKGDMFVNILPALNH